MNSHIYSLSIFNGEPRKFNGGKNSLFSTQAWTTGCPHKPGQLAVHTNKRMTLEPFPSSIYKKILLYTTDLNTRVEAGKGQTMGPKAGEHRMSHRQDPGLHTDDCGPLPQTLEVGKCQEQMLGWLHWGRKCLANMFHLPFNLSVLKVGESRHWYKRLERNGFVVGITFPKECKSRGIPWGFPWHLQKCQPQIKESSRY